MGLAALVAEVRIRAIGRTGTAVRHIDQDPVVLEVGHDRVGVGAAVSPNRGDQIVGTGTGWVIDPEDLDALEARLGQRSVAGLLWRGGCDRRVDRSEHQVASPPDIPLEGATVDLGQYPGPGR